VITITVTAPVTASAVSITNSATVSAGTSDLISGNNTATASTTVNATADLSITKTDTPDPVTVGGTLTYTLAVTNNGPSTASTVSVSDTLPAGVTYGSASGTGWACSQSAGIVTCTRSTLALGAAPPITITVTAPGTSGSITNSATVSTITNDPTIGNNTATASTTVNAAASADLEMVSNIDAPDPVVAGASMTYTYTVINNGPSTATNLDVKGYLPPGVTYVSAVGTGWTCSESSLVVTCTRTSLTSGTTAPIIVITVLAKSEGGTMSSSATVSSSVGDPIASNNSKTAGTNVTSSSDLSIIKTGPDTVTTNGAMTYTLAVTNNGPSTATSVSVSDTLPAGVTFTSFSAAGWNCVHNTGLVSCTLPSSLAPGAAPSIAINATAPSTPGPISNTATVSSAVNDPVNGNNSSKLSTSSNSPPLTSADLSITKTDSPDPVLVNQNLTYLITVTNNGPDAATGVSVTDTLPAGVTYVSATPSQGSCSQAAGTVTCPIGTIAYPGSATVTIVVTPTAAGTLNNSAGVSSTTSDPNGSNNNAGPVSTVVNSAPGIGADLSVTNTDSPDPVPLVGGHVTYTIVVTNNGPGSATGVTMTDLLDASTALFGSPVSSQGTCSGTTTITCAIGTLASGSSATVTVVTTTSLAQMIGNTASVSANETDPNIANNSVMAATNVGDLSRLLAISTRAYVSTGSNREIAGFIIGGNLPKKVIIRGRGPSMGGAPFNITGTLTNPYLTLNSSTGVIAQNDNWGNQSDPLCASSGYVCGTPAEISATGMAPCVPNPGQTSAPPGCTNESALLITLPPGAYTAILSGVNNGQGVGLVEVYDTDGDTLPKITAISTRAQVMTGFNRMIGGFIIGAGNGSKKILIKARGPSMGGAPFNINGTLANPYVTLVSSTGVIAQNDNWGNQSDPLCASSGYVCGTPAEISATGMDPCVPNPGQTSAPPNCANESAILITVPPGSYTAIVSGVNGGTGVGLAEVYEVTQ